MKKQTIVVALIAVVCVIGCSKEKDATSSESGSSAPRKSKRLVPVTAAEVTASPDYKLEHTTKSGIQCYVRPVTVEIAKSIKARDDSPDDEFLHGEDTSAPYFLVLIRNGKIIDGEAAAAGAMATAEAGEVMGFVMKRDPKMQEILKETGRK